LIENFEHADCGVYAEVVTAGDIAVGDAIISAS
jgi:MOSC domain-containing protein YiiM